MIRVQRLRDSALASALYVALLGASGCSGCYHSQPVSTPEQRRADSIWAAYLRHDSTVIDSIARTISTDSLYHLNHALLTAPDMEKAVIAMNCEGVRLSSIYNIRPTELAEKRMADTLWKLEKDARGRIARRMPTSLFISCGPSRSRPTPPYCVDGVSLRHEPSRFYWNRAQVDSIRNRLREDPKWQAECYMAALRTRDHWMP